MSVEIPPHSRGTDSTRDEGARSGTSPRGLSVFFPAYNDSGTIASMVLNALLTARRLTPDHEVIAVSYTHLTLPTILRV